MPLSSPGIGADDKTGNVVVYSKGLRIDYAQRAVEVDGKVCMRQGLLELFACIIRTREHESVVVVKPQPKRIHEALGLIGLTPGHPVRYDEANNSWIPPTGESLLISVRFVQDGKTREVPIGDWMREIDNPKPLGKLDWVFSGSFTTEAGTFTADADGTVIAVVDFPSALIALPFQKSADNELLWLEARTDAIPRLGTDVTLVIRPAAATIVIRMSADGVCLCDNRPANVDALTTCVDRFRKANPNAERINIRLEAEAGIEKARVEETAARLKKTQGGNATVNVVRIATPSKDDVDPKRPARDSDQP